MKAVSSPADLKFTKSHEWVRVDGDVATIGLADHAQSELGDITYLELPDSAIRSQQASRWGLSSR